MRTGRWGIALLVVTCLGLCCGCGPGGKRRALRGSVTFAGRPLEQGNITFLTTAGPPGPVCGALIRAGRYDVPAAQGLEPGTYRVAISSPVPGGTLTPEEKAAGASPRARERLPPQYNAASTLTVEVTAGGPNQFDFNLE
jgi:hypothetical protein